MLSTALWLYAQRFFCLLCIVSLFFCVWFTYSYLIDTSYTDTSPEILLVFHLPYSVEYSPSAPLIHPFKEYVLSLYYLSLYLPLWHHDGYYRKVITSKKQSLLHCGVMIAKISESTGEGNLNQSFLRTSVHTLIELIAILVPYFWISLNWKVSHLCLK